MRRVFHLAETYAPTDATVLIEGETGTGKEVLAEEIHRHSQRHDKPFIVIDCAALAKELIESELFGHTKGAFTGANGDRVGAFEHAERRHRVPGRDRRPEPRAAAQAAARAGKAGDQAAGQQPACARSMCASSAPPTAGCGNEVNAGRFREDLYFRLSVVHIELPPLRRAQGRHPPAGREVPAGLPRRGCHGASGRLRQDDAGLPQP